MGASVGDMGIVQPKETQLSEVEAALAAELGLDDNGDQGGQA
ncbi:hypothetical protein [Streptomyces sp. NBC_00454]